MSARKLIYRLMLASPVALLGIVALHARVYVDPYEVPATDSIQQRRINELAPLTLRTAAELVPGQMPSPERLVSLAAEWTDAVRAGRLDDLRPVAFGDSVEQGVKAEIFRAKSALNSELTQAGIHFARQGRTDRAAEILMQSIEFGEVLKYSDFLSLNISNLEQRRALRELARLNVSEEASRTATLRLSQLLASLPGLEPMTDRARMQFVESRMRRNLDPILIEEPQSTLTVRAATVEGAPQIRAIKNTMLASGGADGLPQLYSAVKLGWASHGNLRQSLEEAIDRFASAATERLPN